MTLMLMMMMMTMMLMTMTTTLTMPQGRGWLEGEGRLDGWIEDGGSMDDGWKQMEGRNGSKAGKIRESRIESGKQ